MQNEADLENPEPQHKFKVDGRALLRKRVEFIYGQLPLILLADVVMGSFLFALFLTLPHSDYALPWITVIIVTSTARALIAGYHRRREFGDDELDERITFLIVGALVSGLTWGNAWLLLPQDPSLLQSVLIIMWLAGMQAGAVTVMTPIWRVFLAYSLPAGLCMLAYVLLEIDENKYAIAGALIVFYCFIVPIAARIRRDFSNTLELQIHNTQLLDSLVQEETRLKQREQELEEQRLKSQTLEVEKESTSQELRAATHEKLLILDAIDEGVFGINDEGRITFTNASALAILHCEESDLLGKDFLDLIAKSNTNLNAEHNGLESIQRCLQAGEASRNIETRLISKHGKRLPVRLSCNPIMQADAFAGAVISIADVSKQKEMEAMLFQSQKMEAIGRLTGGVAHDFNNLLTVIIGNLHFIKRKVTADGSVAPLVQKVMDAAKSGGELNNRLLSFSREQPLETELIEVGEFLGSLKDFLEPLLGEEIELEINTAPGEAVIQSDRTQLQNAILNLCVNSRDAMPNGGKLSISTKPVTLEHSFIHGDDRRGAGEYIEITVADNGVGIPAAMQERIFEPFFTTKGKDEGSGLGLATVYGFVRQCQGNIVVNSREGEWTRFRIYLPLSEGKPELMSSDKQDSPRQEQVFRGTILVVEDNDEVREVAVNNLVDVGFKVMAANNGKEGLEVFRRNQEEIELVFSDVVMPGGMNGIEMTEQIRQLSPDIPVLLVTGYTDKALKSRAARLKNLNFLAKPYDLDEIPALIQSMINQGGQEDSNQIVS